MVNVVEIKDVCVNYKKDYYALLNFSYCFEASKNYQIIGESESGKSTLVRLLTGLETKYNGEMLVDGKVVGKDSDFFKNEFGMIAGLGVFFENKTVLQNLKYAFYIRNNKKIEYDFESVLKVFGLLDKKDVKAKKLSDYDRLMLALSRLSLRSFTFLVLDEIFEFLEYEEVLSFLNMLEKINYKSLVITSKSLLLFDNLDFEVIPLKAGFIDTEFKQNLEV